MTLALMLTSFAAGGDGDGKKKKRRKKVASSGSVGGGERDAGLRSAGGGGSSGRGGLRIIDDEADMAALDKRRVNKAWEDEETAGVADGGALVCMFTLRLVCWCIM